MYTISGNSGHRPYSGKDPNLIAILLRIRNADNVYANIWTLMKISFFKKGAAQSFPHEATSFSL